MDQEKPDYEGIGGWLLLPMLGMLLSVFLVAKDFFGEFVPLLLNGSVQVLTDPASVHYNRLWMPLIVVEGVSNLLLLTLPAVALFFIMRRSAFAPKIAIVWLITVLIVNSAITYLGSNIPLIADETDGYESAGQLFRSLISAAIWIPYFLVSKRVKATFIR